MGCNLAPDYSPNRLVDQMIMRYSKRDREITFDPKESGMRQECGMIKENQLDQNKLALAGIHAGSVAVVNAHCALRQARLLAPRKLSVTGDTHRGL